MDTNSVPLVADLFMFCYEKGLFLLLSHVVSWVRCGT